MGIEHVELEIKKKKKKNKLDAVVKNSDKSKEKK